MILLFKCSVKIRTDYESRQIERHLKWRCYRVQIAPPLFQDDIVNILHAGHIHVFFEKTHEVVFTEIAKLGKF